MDKLRPRDLYIMLRRAGFSHNEAYNYVNKGKIPNLNTQIKKAIIEQIKQGARSNT